LESYIADIIFIYECCLNVVRHRVLSQVCRLRFKQLGLVLAEIVILLVSLIGQERAINDKRGTSQDRKAICKKTIFGVFLIDSATW
jgi:hypothetical protein